MNLPRTVMKKPEAVSYTCGLFDYNYFRKTLFLVLYG